MYLKITDGKNTYGEISIYTRETIGNKLGYVKDISCWINIKNYTEFLLKHDPAEYDYIIEVFSKLQEIRGLFFEQRNLWPEICHKRIDKFAPLSELYEVESSIYNTIKTIFAEDFEKLDLFFNVD